MKHILLYRCKVMMRNRAIVFWSIMFPIVLMTLFGMVLRQSFQYTSFDTIPVAIVENESWNNNTALQTVLKEAKSEDTPLFKVSVLSKEEAEKQLKDESISAYVICGESYDIHVNTSGFNQTITQTFFDEYLQKTSMVTHLMSSGASLEQIQNLFTDTSDYISVNSDANTDMTNVYFYSALAMSAMFGGMWAITAIIDIQADQSQKGARISLAPTNKAVHLIASLCLNLIAVFIILCMQFAYIYVLFDVSFGDLLPYMFLILMAGDIAGSALGAFIGTVTNSKNPDSKVGMLSSITMLCSFLSGMMIVQLKWIIQHYIPFLNYINPVNMITDALYGLYYFGLNDRFFFNLISLLVFSLICYSIAFFKLSKKQYKTVGGR